MIHADVLHERGESLVEPEVRPPGGRDQVAEPLVGQLVGHNQGDAVLVAGAAQHGVVQHGGFSVKWTEGGFISADRYSIYQE